MTTALPYVSNLSLGCIVDPATMATLAAMAEATAKIDAAHDHLNSQIAMKRSLDMTAQELEELDIDTSDLTKKMHEMDESIDQAASNYAKVRIEQEAVLQPLRAKSAMVNASYESPINWIRSELKSMELGADSIKLNVQYFGYDKNSEEVDNQLSNIRSFVAGSGKFFGAKLAAEMANAAVSQVNKQRESHDVEGTLIITASCTHRDVAMFAPLVLDVDKAIRVWNEIHPARKDQIIADDWSMQAALALEGTEADLAMHIVSGAAFGSSFVGMVHILRREKTDSKQSTSDLNNSFQFSAESGGTITAMQGGFGIESSTLNDIRRLLSKAEIDSHVTLITAGMIPAFASNTVAMSVKEFSNFDPAAMMKDLCALQNETNTSHNNLRTAADAALIGGQLVTLKKATIKTVMGSVSRIDAEKNKMLNLDSMITAFENYISRITEDKSDGKMKVTGTLPVQYFIKPITRSQLIHMWMNKYYPGEYLQIQGDDSQAKTSK